MMYMIEGMMMKSIIFYDKQTIIKQNKHFLKEAYEASEVK